ncbi:hypothetical protein KCU78_g8890, partial [Aureobasidium melanogenum]
MGINEMNIDVQSSSGGKTDNGAEAALVRKIDWRIIPTLFIAYFLQFLDKVAVNVRYHRLHAASQTSSVLKHTKQRMLQDIFQPGSP